MTPGSGRRFDGTNHVNTGGGGFFQFRKGAGTVKNCRGSAFSIVSIKNEGKKKKKEEKNNPPGPIPHPNPVKKNEI